MDELFPLTMIMNNWTSLCVTLLAMILFQPCHTFRSSFLVNMQSTNISCQQLFSIMKSRTFHDEYLDYEKPFISDRALVSRRSATCFCSRFLTGSTLLLLGPSDAVHAAVPTSDVEVAKMKIVAGYQRLTYLLDNWVKETTVCGRSDNPYVTGKGCERTPLKVMDYLGYKNIDDPLFRADRTMKKLESLVPNERFSDYLDAIEKWSEAAEEGNGMAFISSWGEANPGVRTSLHQV